MTCLRPTQLCGGRQTKRKLFNFLLLVYSKLCGGGQTKRKLFNFLLLAHSHKFDNFSKVNTRSLKTKDWVVLICVLKICLEPPPTLQENKTKQNSIVCSHSIFSSPTKKLFLVVYTKSCSGLIICSPYLTIK